MQPTLTTPRLSLRPFRADDGDALHAYLSDPATVRFEPYDPLTIDQARLEAARRAGDDAFWAVCLAEDGRLIGNLYFARQQPAHFNTYELGYVLSPQYTGQGYATEAAARMLRHAFETLDAHRVQAHCNPQNEPSWRLLERLGMRREGYFLQHVYFKLDAQGQPLWHDAYAYGILAAEWAETSRQ